MPVLESTMLHAVPLRTHILRLCCACQWCVRRPTRHVAACLPACLCVCLCACRREWSGCRVRSPCCGQPAASNCSSARLGSDATGSAVVAHPWLLTFMWLPVSARDWDRPGPRATARRTTRLRHCRRQALALAWLSRTALHLRLCRPPRSCDPGWPGCCCSTTAASWTRCQCQCHYQHWHRSASHSRCHQHLPVPVPASVRLPCTSPPLCAPCSAPPRPGSAPAGPGIGRP